MGDPLNERVLDPSWGSGTFMVERVSYFINAANGTKWEPREDSTRHGEAVTIMDVHPLAVQLSWRRLDAGRPGTEGVGVASLDASISIPVYSGDTL